MQVLSTTTQQYATRYPQQRKIVKTSEGTLVVFAHINNELKYSISINDGDTWGAWSASIYSSIHLHSFSVVIDSSDNIFVAIGMASGDYQRIYCKKLTYQGSNTWSIGSLEELGGGYNKQCYAPVITIRSNGDIWVAWRRSSLARYSISTDGGSFWSSPASAVSSPTFIYSVSIIPKGSNIWLFIETNNKLIVYEYATSWDGGTEIASSGITNSTYTSSCLKIADNNIWIAGRTTSGLKVFHYTGTWDSGEIITDNSTDSHPSFSDVNSKPVLVWQDYDGSNYDVVYREHNGTSWNSQIDITNDAVADMRPTTLDSHLTKLCFLWTKGDSSPYNIYFNSINLLTIVNLSDTIQIAETHKVYDECVVLEESIKVTESLEKQCIVSEVLKISESLVHQIPLEESIVHYRDFMQSYNYQNLNPPYHYETWYIENPVPGTSINRVLPSYFVGSIENVTIHCKNKGSSGETKINVKLNGDSIFYNDSDKPVLPFDISKDYDNSSEPYLKLIGKNDLITIDIEGVATGATGLTVNIAISQTSIPISVQKIEAIDENGFVYSGTDVLGSNTLYFKVYFSTSFLFPPSIQIVNSEGNTTDLELDTISTTTISNDTITTKSIDTSEYAGNYTLVIKNATSSTGILQDPFEKLYLFSDEDILDYLEHNRYSNNAEVNITVSNLAIFKNSISSFSYSLNNIDWTDDTDFTNPFVVDITNSTVGGNITEEDKTIYLRFKNKEGSGYLAATITIGYYYSAISFDAYYIRHSSDMYIVDYNLPDSATTVPLKGLDIYNGGTLIKSLTFENLPLSDFDIVSIWEAGNSRFKIDVDTGYVTGSKGDTLYSVEASTFYIDQPTDNLEELYLVMIEVDTNTIVCQRVLTKALDTTGHFESPHGHKSITHDDFIGIVSSYREDYVVLYGIHVCRLNDESVVYNYVHNYALVAVSVTGTSLDLSIKITDQAGRIYTNDMTDLTKNNKMKISVHLSRDPDSNAVSATLENATIVNELPDSFYVTGEYINE